MGNLAGVGVLTEGSQAKSGLCHLRFSPTLIATGREICQDCGWWTGLLGFGEPLVEPGDGAETVVVGVGGND
jgi:hypothetical protein